MERLVGDMEEETDFESGGGPDKEWWRRRVF